MDSLWTIDATGAPEREKSSFVNAAGEDEEEEMQPMPPPSLRQAGMSSASLHRLERDTGDGHVRPRKNAEAMEPPLFEDDRVRAAFAFNEDASSRVNSLVKKNRSGTQSAADHESMLSSHSDLYNGYNVKQPIPREGTHVPTRREQANWTVTGNERSKARLPAMESTPNDVLKTGMHHKVADQSQGRGGVVLAPSMPSQHLHMGGEGNVAALRPAPKQFAATDASSVPSHPTLHREARAVLPLNTSAKRSLFEHETARSALPLAHARPDVEETAKLGRAIGKTHLPGIAGAASLSSGDSWLASPAPKRSFDQIAASATGVVLGAQDATRAFDPRARMPLDSFQAAARATANLGTERAFRASLPSADGASTTLHALSSARGRDAGSDSHAIERMEPNKSSMGQFSGQAAGTGRPLRPDPEMKELDRSVRNAHGSHAPVAASGALGTKDAHDLVNNVRNGLIASVRAAGSIFGKMTSKGDANVVQPAITRQTLADNNVSVPTPVQTRTGTEREGLSHSPPRTGTSVRASQAALPPSAGTSRETPVRPANASMGTVAPVPMADFTQRGNRE